jgi:hypothetical protein
VRPYEENVCHKIMCDGALGYVAELL